MSRVGCSGWEDMVDSVLLWPWTKDEVPMLLLSGRKCPDKSESLEEGLSKESLRGIPSNADLRRARCREDRTHASLPT